MAHIERPTIPTCATHFHPCPRCYEHWGCGDLCTTEQDLGEHRGLPVGVHEVCVRCVVPSTFVASEPERDASATVGLVWYSLHLLDALLRVGKIDEVEKAKRAKLVAEVERCLRSRAMCTIAYRALDREDWLRECARRGVRFVCHGAVITNAGENTAAFRLVLRERGGPVENMLALLAVPPP